MKLFSKVNCKGTKSTPSILRHPLPKSSIAHFKRSQFNNNLFTLKKQPFATSLPKNNTIIKNQKLFFGPLKPQNSLSKPSSINLMPKANTVPLHRYVSSFAKPHFQRASIQPRFSLMAQLQKTYSFQYVSPINFSETNSRTKLTYKKKAIRQNKREQDIEFVNKILDSGAIDWKEAMRERRFKIPDGQESIEPLITFIYLRIRDEARRLTATQVETPKYFFKLHKDQLQKYSARVLKSMNSQEWDATCIQPWLKRVIVPLLHGQFEIPPRGVNPGKVEFRENYKRREEKLIRALYVIKWKYTGVREGPLLEDDAQAEISPQPTDEKKLSQ